MTDFSKTPDAVAWREQREQARVQVRRRYLDYLAGVFSDYGLIDAAGLAEMAIGALFDWRRVVDGERCECGCHPRLSGGDLHDGGFDCVCTKTAEQRSQGWQRWWAESEAFWNSPAGQRIREREAAEESELQGWLATQPGVVLSCHGGSYPELWEGTVDGHSFYFRERWGDWRIELDLRPNGLVGQVVTGVDDQGGLLTEDFEHSSGQVIAEGTTFTDGYGETPTQRAEFIVDVVRVQLSRETCTHHSAGGAALRVEFGDEVRWCPFCGTRLVAPRGLSPGTGPVEGQAH